QQDEAEEDRDRVTEPLEHVASQRGAFWVTQPIASSSRRSNSARLSLKRWSDAFTIHSFFGSFAASITVCTVDSATNSSWVEWMAAIGVGLRRATTAAALKVGSLGMPWV